MTATASHHGDGVVPEDLVTVTIDDTTVSVPVGTLLIRAAELIGIQIPRFCDHPLLDPVGACRQCLVEVEGQRKPMASCTVAVTDGMIAHTQLSSAVAQKAQAGVMELLLINHPLDCPVCDKGGECPLQNQAMSSGRPESRFEGVKRTFPKPIPLSAAVLLDRERCVLCARCTRFSQQIAGDPFIDMIDRGALQQVGIADGEPMDSYFSGNTVQICPVGALTGTTYRFRSRPFDLVSSPTVCEHCAAGCAQRTDHRRGKILRRLAGDDPQVNEEWNCDKGRWAFAYATEPDRLTTPLIRDDSGALVPASWPEALARAAAGLSAARGDAGVLVGGRAGMEDAYAYAKFARIALATNDIDFRARAHSAEEAEYLAAAVAGHGVQVDYATVQSAPVVVLAGLDPEEECPILHLRLRKAVRTSGTAIYSLAPFESRGLQRLSGRLIRTVPGDEARLVRALSVSGAGYECPPDPAGLDELARALRQPGAIVLAGERLAALPGALSAIAALTENTGATAAWVPRRAGERGALEAGALPQLLPGGRPLANARARHQVEKIWQVDELPATPGRDTRAILDAQRRSGALLVGGVELADLPDPRAALAAVQAAGFVVSLELRHSDVTEHADVVFPIAAAMEKAGTYLTWEGRARPFGAALADATVRRLGAPLADHRVLHSLADAMGVRLGLPTIESARTELEALGRWDGPWPLPPSYPAPALPETETGTAVVTGWRLLLDNGRMQDGEPNLARTARPAVVRLSSATATEIGAATGDSVRISTGHGRIALPLAITDMPDRVAWLPWNSADAPVNDRLTTAAGHRVRIQREDPHE